MGNEVENTNQDGEVLMNSATTGSLDASEVELESCRGEHDQSTISTTRSRILGFMTPKVAAEDQGPPNGGLKAWTQVLMSHLINFNSFGYLISFGIFQGYYTQTLGVTESDISWIGTIALFLAFFISGFSGRALDAGYYPITLSCGLFLQLLGVFMTSLSTKYWQLFLAQGLCQGIGNGLLFCPAVALVSTYFTARKRALAVSCVACGGATGGIVFPAIAQTLLDRVGFPWTIRVMGFVMLFNTILALSFSRTRLAPRKTGPLIDREALRESHYLLFCVGVFLAFWGLFFVYFYIRPFGRDVLHTSEYSSFNVLLILNGMGVPGRLVPALISDRFIGPLNTLIPFTLVVGTLSCIWIDVTSLRGQYAWVTIYGFFGGGVQSLVLTSSTTFTTDLKKNGGRLGIVLTAASLACLSGSPIGGQLILDRDGNYLGAQIFAGTVIFCGGLFLLGARLSYTGLHLRRRA